jgi:hypothetical protein
MRSSWRRTLRLSPYASEAGAGSPPLAFQSTLVAAGAVERVELRHVLLREGEVEDLGVLRDPLTVRRLRDERNVALDAPAEQYLGRRAPEALRDPCRCFARDVVTVPERAVSLENDPVPSTSSLVPTGSAPRCGGRSSAMSASATAGIVRGGQGPVSMTNASATASSRFGASAAASVSALPDRTACTGTASRQCPKAPLRPRGHKTSSCAATAAGSIPLTPRTPFAPTSVVACGVRVP